MTASAVTHQYYPLDIHLPYYVANGTSTLSLIVQFGLLWAAALGGGFVIIRRVRPTASRSDQLAFVWMCLTGFIHLFFEAFFVVNHESLAGSQQLFGQLWKEYSLSDSRYLTSDAFLVCMEAVTAFCWGPLAFFIAYSIAVQHPARHALQLVLSLGQVYGDVLYYATSLFDLYVHGDLFCRPERYYFWFYYFFFNFIWMFIGCSDEVTAKFAPSAETLCEVQSWLTEAGISAGRLAQTQNRGWLVFHATSQEIEHLFNTTYYGYHNRKTGKKGIACQRHHVPASIQKHIDYVHPGVLLSPSSGKPTGPKKRSAAHKKAKPAVPRGRPLSRLRFNDLISVLMLHISSHAGKNPVFLSDLPPSNCITKYQHHNCSSTYPTS
ncbi:hypothetical protein BBP40_009988 [Aspergillus hancockii]|nr:hypothetical protein BBP40_009988 [Aspergillus hancockii]